MTSRNSGRTTRNDLLEQDLRDLVQAIEFPPAPDIATRVRARLLQEQQPVGPGRLAVFPRPLRLAVLAFAVLIAIAAALALNPTTRDALARFFGLKRVQIIYEDSVPVTATALSTPIQESPVPAVTPAQAVAIETRTGVPVTATPSPTNVRATPERLARPAETLTGATTLQDARSRAPFTVLAPAYPEDLGEPDDVYLQELGRPGEAQVILVYPHFALYQFRATGIFTKLVTPGTSLQEVSVKGARGYWLDAAFHLIEYHTADGREVVDFRRQVAGNTLAWEVDDLTYRLETTLTLEEAIKVAESLR